MKKVLFLLLVPSLILLFACQKKNGDLEKDIKKVGDLMCRSMELMNKLKAANPSDTMMITYLQKKNEDLQAEMTTFYSEFRQKYSKQLEDPAFTKEFNTGIKKAMLDCKFLSNEDREKFMKEE